MNDHVGWTKDGKCALCLSSDSTKPCTGFSEDANYMGKIIARVLNVQISDHNSGTLTKSMSELDTSVKQQMQMVKEIIAKICEQKIQDHKCAGVVPGTFVVCGEDDYQYCSDACLNIARHTKEIKKQTGDHPSDCGWWKDWHSCSCGVFDKK